MNPTPLKISPLVWLGIAITVVAALFSISKRVHVESRNKAVALVADYALVQSMSRGDMPKALSHLKAMGLTGMTVSEITFADAVNTGRASINIQDNTATIWLAPGFDQSAAIQSLSTVFEGRVRTSGANLLIITDYHNEPIRPISLGLDPAACAAATENGMFLVGRFGNQAGLTEAGLNATLQRAKTLGISAYLPEGDQVLGQREMIGAAAEKLASLGMRYCSPEFTKIAGDEKFAEKSKENLIRLHSAQSNEIDKMTPAEYFERYVKAARERNMRILLLRPLSTAGGVEAFGETVQKLAKNLEKEGLTLGAPHPFEDSAVPGWARPLIGVGLAITLFALGASMGLSVLGQRALTGLALIAFVGTCLHPGWHVAALIAAMTFPVLAYVILEANPTINPWLAYVVTTLVSLVGGLAIAGILNGLPFFIRLDQFQAVKLAVFLPIAIVAWFLLARRVDMLTALRSPATWLGLLAGVLGLAVIGLLLARTGNDNPAAVSGIELKLRSLLEVVFLTRPRTKEFLLGHPAMLLGLLVLTESRKPNAPKSLGILACGLLTVGAIGQTSVVNTMCHLHTPVLLSLARIAIGWVIGGILGALAWVLIRARIHKGQSA